VNKLQAQSNEDLNVTQVKLCPLKNKTSAY
jgi:hypothetical protein